AVSAAAAVGLVLLGLGYNAELRTERDRARHERTQAQLSAAEARRQQEQAEAQRQRAEANEAKARRRKEEAEAQRRKAEHYLSLGLEVVSELSDVREMPADLPAPRMRRWLVQRAARSNLRLGRLLRDYGKVRQAEEAYRRALALR